MTTTPQTATRATAADDLARRRTKQFAVIAALSAVLLVATYLVFVRTGVGQRFDDIAFDGRGIEDPEITQATNDVLHRVTRSTLALFTLAIVLFAVARRRVRLAIAAGAAITASVVTTEVLKLRVLDRPQLDDIAGIQQNSFPSGHATIGMSLSLGLGMVAPHAVRWLATVAAIGVSMLLGVGVLATGWHRPSDTFGAYLVCVTMFSIATALLLRWRGAGTTEQREMGAVEERLTPFAAGVVGLTVIAAAIGVLFFTFDDSSFRTIELGADYVLVSVVILVLATVIVAGYHQLLRGISLDAPAEDSEA